MKPKKPPPSASGILDAPLAAVALDILLENFPVPGATWNVFAAPDGGLIAQLSHPHFVGEAMARLLPGRGGTEGPLSGAPLAWTETVRTMVRALSQPTQARGGREIWVSQAPQVSHVLASPLAELGYEIGQALMRGQSGPGQLTAEQAIQVCRILQTGQIFDLNMNSQRDESSLGHYLGARRRRPVGHQAGRAAVFHLDMSGTFDPRNTDGY